MGDIERAEIEINLGARRQADLGRVEGPHLGDHVDLVMMVALVDHVALLERRDIGDAGRKRDVEAGGGIHQRTEEQRHQNAGDDESDFFGSVHGTRCGSASLSHDEVETDQRTA